MTGTCACGTPIADDRSLCPACVDQLGADLQRIPALTIDLDLTLTKQRRYGTNGNGDDMPLPFNPTAATAIRQLHAALAQAVADTRRHHVASTDYANRGPGVTTTTMATWLTWRLDGIATQPWATDTAATIHRAVTHGLRVIDRPPDLAYAGPCDECGADLYAPTGRGTVTCRACGLTWDLAERRTWLLGLVEDRLATATEIARALTGLGNTVTAERIWQWKHRDRITPRTHDRAGRPLYRVGDVLDLLLAEPEHPQQRSA